MWQNPMTRPSLLQEAAAENMPDGRTTETHPSVHPEERARVLEQAVGELRVAGAVPGWMVAGGTGTVPVVTAAAVHTDPVAEDSIPAEVIIVVGLRIQEGSRSPTGVSEVTGIVTGMVEIMVVLAAVVKVVIGAVVAVDIPVAAAEDMIVVAAAADHLTEEPNNPTLPESRVVMARYISNISEAALAALPSMVTITRKVPA